MSVLLEFHEVAYAYPQLPGLERRPDALQGITFQVRQGERLALLGANGAGKSTLLWMLNGTLKPSSGRVSFAGRPVEYARQGLHALRRQVVLVTQDPDDQLFAGSLREDVSFGPMNLGLPPELVMRRANDALALMDLGHLAHLPPHQLSQGQRKRAAIAGAVAMKPRVLVLDEPTAGLDPRSIASLRGVLGTLESQGTTVILCTHDIDFAGEWASRALVLQEGRLCADGGAEEIMGDEALMSRSCLRVPVRLLLRRGQDLDPC